MDRVLSLFLANMKSSGSFLFSGPKGSGTLKKSIEFSKAVNCENRSKSGIFYERICGSCRNCTRIEKLTHPDIVLIEPEGGSIKIDKIRDLIGVISLKPYEAEFRFIIIKDADLMNVEASNALLKSLEEPPDKTVFVLTTNRAHALLETILSRCFIIKFPPPSKEDVKNRLKSTGDIGNDEIESLTILSESDPERAVQLRDEGWVDKRNWIIDQFMNLDNTGKTGLMIISEKISDNKTSLSLYLKILLTLLRDVEIYRNNPELIVNRDKIKYIEQLSLELNSDAVLKRYQLVSEAENSLKFNLNLKILIENMMFGLAYT